MRGAGIAIAFLAACGADVSPEIDAPPADAPVDAEVDAAIDGPPGTCFPRGTGVVNGTLEGASVGPVARANLVTAGGGKAIVIDEVVGQCGVPSQSGEHIVLGFCTTPAPGTYPIVDFATFGCPGTNAFGLLERGGGADLGEGVSGTVTITTASEFCIAGSFDVMLVPPAGAPETPFSGTFDALVCP